MAKKTPVATQRKFKNEGELYVSTFSETEKTHVYHAQKNKTYHPEQKDALQNNCADKTDDISKNLMAHPQKK